MITLLVGHRGTGKSELIQRLQFYLRDRNTEFVDLDVEIEKKIGKTILELFMEHGEAYFRELERQVFIENLQKPHQEMYMVAGAGFDMKVVPAEVRILWVRRRTDLDGRIFLNRPRLNPDISPLDEFKRRAEVREQGFVEAADEVYLMPEGHFENKHFAMSIERSILLHEFNEVGGCLTILPDIFSKSGRWDLFKKRFQGKGVSYFELRNDFLSREQIEFVLKEMPNEKFIYSCRDREQSLLGGVDEILARVQFCDWALELGEPAEWVRLIDKKRLILSLHQGSPDEFSRYKGIATQFKFAPLIQGFEALAAGHGWQAEDPNQRSFLPRSSTGDLIWYRLIMKGRQLINFWKESEGSALDQPSLFQWLSTPAKVGNFAAVVGDPVHHSFTPIEHSDYFHKKNAPVLAIRVPRGEETLAFSFLQKLGLRWAAVTAPHKEFAASLCMGTELKALNTLYFSTRDQAWKGASTDEFGFADLTEGIGMIAPLQKEIFVWGGGGTLSTIQKELPHASFYSSRTGKNRSSVDAEITPKVVIWAAPRGSETKWPPESWSPAIVLDLNYKEDSMGREYAQRCGANYTSGLTMFLGQARQQRVFWSQCEESQ